MKSRHPLRQILSRTRPHWDTDAMRPCVRRGFGRALQCRTPELGAEVYASENQRLKVYHTCKSRPCSSCGHRSTLQWQRERWAALPAVPYKDITFTMPDVLWPIFRDNPHLTAALPALAATTIEIEMTARYGLRVGVVAVLHTFNGKLEFNSHVHTMVSGGGLRTSSGTWVPRAYYKRDELTRVWRKAVIALLQAALRADQLHRYMTAAEMEVMLTQQEKRWWSVKIKCFASKEHFLRYAGRYVRRPPIAQRRIVLIGNRTVTFWYKDKKLRRKVYVQCSVEEFIDRWAQHIPQRYRHAARTFGLFAPRALALTSSAVFAILGQKRRPRPKPLRWAESIKRDFGRDPLLDNTGKRMKWVGRLAPKTSC